MCFFAKRTLARMLITAMAAKKVITAKWSPLPTVFPFGWSHKKSSSYGLGFIRDEVEVMGRQRPLFSVDGSHGDPEFWQLEAEP